MSIHKSIHNVNENKEKWEQAIQDATELLAKVEKRAVRLRGAIKVFTEYRDSGTPFSLVLAQSNNQNSTEQHGV
jgi:hypothetical protein